MLLKTISRPLKSITLAVILGAALSGGASSAFAGAAELKALQAALPLGVTIDQATTQQLFDAFTSVVFSTDSKFNTTKKQGVVAGEALKAAGPNATDAGEFFGQQIAAATNSGDQLNPLLLDRRNFVALAASTAGSGKGLNVSQIPGLAAETFLLDPSTFTSAALSTKSKAGIGAIYGGRARQLFASDPTPELSSLVTANSAIFDQGKPTKLSSAAQDIAQWIAAEFGANNADSAAFAVGFADGNSGANLKSAIKIATGTSAGDPTNAGNIIHNLFNQQLLQPDGSLVAPTVMASQNLVNTVVKKTSDIAKKVSAVADIEEIQKISNALGQLMSLPGTKPGTAVLPVSKAASLVKTLATAVMSKPKTDRFGATIIANVDLNKGEEIAEVAAYMIGGLAGSPELAAMAADPKKVGKAASTLLAIITSATGVKPKLVAKVPNGPSPDTFAADVAASVALSVENSALPQTLKDAFQALLYKTDAKGNFTTMLKINKATGTTTGSIKTSLDNVYASTNLIRYEDGNDPLGAVSDPETDSRPFST